MAHILLIDVPGGNDFTVLEDALAMGHEVTFFTSDLSHYERQGEVSARHLRSARKIIEIRPFSYDQFEKQILAITHLSGCRPSAARNSLVAPASSALY
jgi:hypothetical protein